MHPRLALLALVIGVAPGQFLALTLCSRLLQSLQHANLRWRFGVIGERLLVSPSFHRLHHAIGYGHEGRARGYSHVRLDVVDTNWRARVLYERLGFAIEKTDDIGLLRFAFGFRRSHTMTKRL